MTDDSGDEPSAENMSAAPSRRTLRLVPPLDDNSAGRAGAENSTDPAVLVNARDDVREHRATRGPLAKLRRVWLHRLMKREMERLGTDLDQIRHALTDEVVACFDADIKEAERRTREQLGVRSLDRNNREVMERFAENLLTIGWGD